MDGTFVRTSVTVDEAVAILLGWASGPILFAALDHALSDEEQEVLDSATFSLADELERQECQHEFDLEEARDAGASQAVIAERRAAIQRHRELVGLANTYLCAVNDEINKGEQSGLRVDRAASNSAYTYLTLTSLDEWARNRYQKSILAFAGNQAPIAAKTEPKPQAEPEPCRPVVRKKLRDQEEAILAAIRELGHSPQSLPRNIPGKSGVKAATRNALKGNQLFTANGAFDKAWERCRADGSIADSV